ncbi:hypothetical protein IWQ62_006401, partial [Dispira parvispora]
MTVKPSNTDGQESHPQKGERKALVPSSSFSPILGGGLTTSNWDDEEADDEFDKSFSDYQPSIGSPSQVPHPDETDLIKLSDNQINDFDKIYQDLLDLDTSPIMIPSSP